MVVSPGEAVLSRGLLRPSRYRCSAGRRILLSPERLQSRVVLAEDSVWAQDRLRRCRPRGRPPCLEKHTPDSERPAEFPRGGGAGYSSDPG